MRMSVDESADEGQTGMRAHMRTRTRTRAIAAVSFDLDGTLVETAGELVAAANASLEAHGIAARPASAIVTLIGGGSRELMRRLLARCFLEQPALAERVRPEAVLATMDASYAAVAGTFCRPYDGCAEALEALRQNGVKVACVTNKEARHATRVLMSTGLAPLFDLVIGGDSLPHRKPHPTVLRHVAQALATDRAGLAHVGDSELDVVAARESGVAAWAVAYGYNGGAPIADARPDRIFDTVADVALHVLQIRRQGRCEDGNMPPAIAATFG